VKRPTRRTHRYAIYTRQSAEPRDGLSSCEAQFQTCLRYAQREPSASNVWIGERFDDEGVSGRTLDRPALNRLRERVKAGLIDRVYAAALDRYSRNVTDTIQLLEELERASVETGLANGLRKINHTALVLAKCASDAGVSGVQFDSVDRHLRSVRAAGQGSVSWT
jgi:hypothetical protein